MTDMSSHPNAVAVPLDGSTIAEAAVPVAAAIADRTGAVIHLVHVRRMVPADDAEVEPAESYVARVARGLTERGYSVTAALLPEDPPELLKPTPSPGAIARQIVDYAVTQDADVIIMTTHGRSGFSRRWFGSVTDAMLRASSLPVLVVRKRAGKPVDQGFPRILIATGGDDAGPRIMEAARSITRPFDPQYMVVRILPLAYTVVGEVVPATVVYASMTAVDEEDAAGRELAQLARGLESENVQIVTRLHAVPARAILELAAEHDVDLVVVGTRARGRIDRILIGSTADKVARGARCSVLVVPAG